MKVSNLFVQCLENEGVRYVFGLPGEENEDLLFALEKSRIKFIPTRHEQGAAFMADVWGRLTGKAGVCLATLGPGATNLMTGVADAYLDKSPLVAITGQAGRDRTHRESHQYLDIVNMFRPITKWNTAVTRPETVPEIVRKAFKIAEAEKPGATHIELSEDVAEAETEGRPIPAIRVRRPNPDATAIQEAVRLIKNSKRPLFIAGNGAIRKRASRELWDLAQKYQFPVVHTFMGQGAISDAQPESLLTIGLGFRDLVMDAVDPSDLILTVGYDIAEYSPDCWNPEGRKKIIHIDFSPAEVYQNYQPAVEIVADISASLRFLKEGLNQDGSRFDSQWYQPVRQRILADIQSYDLKEGRPFTVPGVLNILRRIMAGDDLLISDVGTHKIWIARNFPVYSANACLISNGLASMGIALPGAIAASLLNPERRIVAAMGDGGFLMNAQELETAKRLGTAFTVLIFNDDDYGQISWKQRLKYGHATGTRLGNPDFKAFAESFGIAAYQPRTLRELEEELENAIVSHELSLIEIPVDQAPLYELARKFGKSEVKKVPA